MISFSAAAQVTTSAISGKVTDSQGSVAGAVVSAVHTPSGTQYYSVTNAEGRYFIQGMRPGGPYEISFQMMGLQTVVVEDVTLTLGETFTYDTFMKDESLQLTESRVVASASSAFTAEKTGASTNISNREMMSLPTTSRSIKDLAKLSPYSNGMSFAGSDGRSTNFTVDGANFNNNFGLSSDLPGGGTPISLDAIEEVQIVVAPFDVRQSNFVGGGINAITKSGTNMFKGSAYGYFTNQALRGNTIAGVDLGTRAPESNLTVGATIGGPIVKNKLFFFVNFEYLSRPEQTIQYKPTDSKVLADLEKIYNKLKNDYNYDPGSYTNYPGGTQNMKILARIDWNINNDHKLSVRFNTTKNTTWYSPNGNSCDDQFRNKQYNRSGANSFPFSNNMYSQMNNVISAAVELNSRFSEMVSNQVIATYTNINDQRGSNSKVFPHIDIMTGDYSSGNFIPFTSLGYELFTYNNGVLNNNINVADNVTIQAGNHKVVAGASWEYMSAGNSYMRNGAGYYRFASVDDFLNANTPLSFAITYGYDGDLNPKGWVTYHKASIYAQDEYAAADNFKLTFGVRADGIFFDNSQLKTNSAILAYNMGGKTIDTGYWPDAKVQVSPRIGFNWDIAGDKSVVLRGGTGLFQGRLPLVFFTNMPQNSNMIQNSVNKGNYSASIKDGVLVYTDAQKANLDKLVQDGKIVTDINEMKKVLGLPEKLEGGGTMPSEINAVDRKFKMPQIWKSSLAIDWRLPVGFPLSITLEGMFNKTINGVRLVDWNLDDSKILKDANRFAGSDTRYNYRKATDGFTYGKTSAYVLTNTNQGYGYTANVTINASPVKNLNIMAAYTRTDSKEISGMPGSAATSAYSSLYSVNGPNYTTLQRSQYVIPDKVMANVSYFIPFEVFGGNGFHVNAYYTAYSGLANSFIYSNDMNGDGIASDLIYIPKNENDILFKTQEDATAFMKFVNADSYLSKHKGQYAEAYAARTPWLHLLDLRIAEDFAFRGGDRWHKFEVSVSFNNLLNLFDSKLGVNRLSCYQTGITNTIAPLKYEETNAEGKPVFSMVKVDGNYPVENYTRYYENSSQCWSVLFGLKYSF